MRTMLALGLGGLLAVGVVRGGDPKGDLAKLQGKWTAELGGKKVQMQFTKDAFTLTFEGEGDFKGTIKIDPSKKPREMDLTVKEGPKYQGMTSLAIYDVDGETLKWCASEPGQAERPKVFPANQGEDKALYLVFKRAK